MTKTKSANWHEFIAKVSHMTMDRRDSSQYLPQARKQFGNGLNYS
jgi:hypothetical protein